MSDFENVPAASSVPCDQRTMALAAHLLGIFTGFIGALIIWLINKDDAGKGFVTDQSKEARSYQNAVGSAVRVCMNLGIVIIGAILMPIVYVANLVLCIIAAVKANNGETYRYPFTLRLIK